MSERPPGPHTPTLTSVDVPEPMAPLEAFAALGNLRLADLTMGDVLARVADLAAQTIPGADEASVTVVQPGRPYTAAFTGSVALDLDEAQYDDEHGPCLDAAIAGESVVIRDMAEDTRWPRFAAAAARRGIASSAAFALPVQSTLCGALNLYSTRVGGFSPDGLDTARTFAAYAAVAVANAHVYAGAAELAAQLQAAMASRSVIEQAKGIVMGERRCTSEAAFAVLVKESQKSNVKLRDLAAALVEAASQPTDASPRRNLRAT